MEVGTEKQMKRMSDGGNEETERVGEGQDEETAGESEWK